MSDRLVSPLSAVAFDPRTSKDQSDRSKLQNFLPTLKRNGSQNPAAPARTEREIKVTVHVERDEEEDDEKKFEIP